MLGGDGDRLVGREPARASSGRIARRQQDASIGLISPDCVIATHGLPTAVHTRLRALTLKIFDSKGFKGIDTWVSDCYLWF